MKKLFLLLIILIIPFNIFAMKPLDDYMDDGSKLYYVMIRCTAINNLYGILDKRFQEITIPNAAAFTYVAFQLNDNVDTVMNDIKSTTNSYQQIANKFYRSNGSYIQGIIASDMAICRELRKDIDF